MIFHPEPHLLPVLLLQSAVGAAAVVVSKQRGAEFGDGEEETHPSARPLNGVTVAPPDRRTREIAAWPRDRCEVHGARVCER